MNGKTVTETFSLRPVWPRRKREVAECQRFRELGEQLLEVNERVCRLRPVEELSHPPRKKTAEVIQREIAREVDQLLRVVFSARNKTGLVDLEAIEMAVRSAMHHAGATAPDPNCCNFRCRQPAEAPFLVLAVRMLSCRGFTLQADFDRRRPK